MINETRERFLRAILERIPLERVVEVHLFPGIRQGQVETGVAVIAVTPAVVADTPAPELDLRESGAPVERTEVHTATYRWTRKGPERGKWVVDVIAQADAPLATVETVVRGVQVRAGEALDAHRISAAELQASCAEFMPQSTQATQTEQDESVGMDVAGSVSSVSSVVPSASEAE